jgi:hypothetical protein
LKLKTLYLLNFKLLILFLLYFFYIILYNIKLIKFL